MHGEYDNMLEKNMALEDILSNVNYNIEKIVEELRKRIMNIPEINETVDKHQTVYKYFEEDFCIIEIKKDRLVIDFKAGQMLEDPIDFSWKIRKVQQKACLLPPCLLGLVSIQKKLTSLKRNLKINSIKNPVLILRYVMML